MLLGRQCLIGNADVVRLESLSVLLDIERGFMNTSRHGFIYVDGINIDVVISKKGSTFYVSGFFGGRQIFGKGRTESEAQLNWKKHAEYEANY